MLINSDKSISDWELNYKKKMQSHVNEFKKVVLTDEQ